MVSLLVIIGHRIDEIKTRDFSGLENELKAGDTGMNIPPEELIDAAVYLKRVSPTSAYDVLLTILDSQFHGADNRKAAVAEYKRRFHEMVGPEIPEELKTILAMYD